MSDKDNIIRKYRKYDPFLSIKEEKDIFEVAKQFCKLTEGEKDDFWSKSAYNLLVMIMVYLWDTESEIKSFERVVSLVNSIRCNEAGTIDEECELAQCINNYIETDEKHKYNTVTVNWNVLRDIPQETLGCIAKITSVRLSLWSVDKKVAKRG